MGSTGKLSSSPAWGPPDAPPDRSPRAAKSLRGERQWRNSEHFVLPGDGGNVVVVTEPLDRERASWKPVPPSHMNRGAPGKAGVDAAPPRPRGARAGSR